MPDKIYVHEGKGITLGSTVIVIAASRKTAEKLIQAEIAGIDDAKVNITEVKPIERNTVIYSYNGDY